MLGKDKFKYYIGLAQKQEERVRNLPKFINYDDPIFDYGNMMFDAVIEAHFTTEGQDWVSWWLYEKHSIITDEVYEAKDEDGNIIPTTTIDDLWELVKEYRK